MGVSFQEKTSAISFNLHGCRYPSRHEYTVGSWVGLRVLEQDGETISPVIRAQVRSIHPPLSPRELFQIGVELESPANIWSIPSPPEDWQRLIGGRLTTSARLAAAATPALNPARTMATPAAQPLPAETEAKTGDVTMFPGPASTAASAPAPERPKEAPPTKPERVAITIDQLVSAMQGKLQHAAEKVVQAALAAHLDEAVKLAIGKIEEASKTNLEQLEKVSAERFEAQMRSYREEILGHLEARLGEVQIQWKEQQEAYCAQAEEISQRLEKLAAGAQTSLTETQKFIEKVSHEQGPQIRGRVEESLSRAAEEFEAAADRVSDRQLIRVMEATRMVTREAAAQLDARVSESRALLQTASNATIEEFRRQAEVQVDLAVTETTERVRSALAALDAENRAACQARRRTLEDDVARATEQSTEQFRSGIKAFLYSCLVAAVGAVDEHAKTTLEGLVRDPGIAPPQIAGEFPPPEKKDDPAA
jgi:hypothetical protein